MDRVPKKCGEYDIIMTRLLEKVERRLGEKLFLKGERCVGPKCAATRRAYPPGAHGKKRARKRGISEFGQLMREKQKVRYLYGLDDRDIERYSKEAASSLGVYSIYFWQLIERRLDNVVFRLGFAESRRIARALVNHGHITVNGRRVDIPSYRVKKGDTIMVKENMWSTPLFAHFEMKIKKHHAPAWLLFDQNSKMGTVVDLPGEKDQEVTFDATKIKEFYSR